jgi:hypothetical protein
MPALEPEHPGSPRELPPGAWEPPPVRCGGGEEEIGAATAEEMTDSEAHAPRVTKRRAWGFIVGMTVFVVLVFAGFGAWAWWKVQNSEERLRDEALRQYSENLFREAAEDFEKLSKKFPNSEFAKEYHLMADWSGLSSFVNDPDTDPSAAIERLDQFVQQHKKEPLLIELAKEPFLIGWLHDVGQRLIKMTKSFAARYVNPTDDQPLKVADDLENLRRRVASLDGALSKEESAQI